MVEQGRTQRRRPRVLLIAEMANPEWVSVPLEGWSLARGLAKFVDVHLVTQIRNRDAVLRAGLIEGHDFTALDNERFAAPIYRAANALRGGAGTGWTTVMALSSFSYYTFEWAVWRKFKERLAAGEFDLVHRLTPISPTHQSPIAKRLAKQKIPFVIGPLNGGVPWPTNFATRQRAEHEWLSHIRSLYKLMPGYRATRRHSAAIIVGSKHTGSELPAWAKAKAIYIPENGVDMDRFANPRTRTATLPLRAAFVGRLVPYKGADIVLESAAEFLRTGHLLIDIIGDGPQRAELEALTDRLGVRQGVRFHGWVAHHAVQDILRDADILVLPSIREFGGGVVVEAMALGVAPVVADYGGPGELVDDDATGIKIPFSDHASLVSGLRATIARFLHTPKDVDRLGAAGRRKVCDKLTWDAKAGQISAIYDAVLTGRKHFHDLNYR